jgi:hypothetical protein
MDFEFEYRSEFDFTLETILGYESRDQAGSFSEEKIRGKYHSSVPLRFIPLNLSASSTGPDVQSRRVVSMHK